MRLEFFDCYSLERCKIMKAFSARIYMLEEKRGSRYFSLSHRLPTTTFVYFSNKKDECINLAERIRIWGSWYEISQIPVLCLVIRRSYIKYGSDEHLDVILAITASKLSIDNIKIKNILSDIKKKDILRAWDVVKLLEKHFFGVSISLAICNEEDFEKAGKNAKLSAWESIPPRGGYGEPLIWSEKSDYSISSYKITKLAQIINQEIKKRT